MRHDGDPLQKRVFEYIVAFKRLNDGNSPSIREIAEGVGINSTSHVDYVLKRLAARGLIRYPPGGARLIQVVGGQWNYPA